MSTVSPLPAPAPESRAPRGLRVLVVFLALLAGLMELWLLGFVLDDLEGIPRPERQAIESEFVDSALRTRLESENAVAASIDDQIARQREIRATLSQSIQNAQGTLDQMLALRRLALEKGLDWEDSDREALQSAQSRFLESQDKLQQAIQERGELEARRHELVGKIAADQKLLETQRRPAERKYQERMRSWRFRVASLQLAFLLPIFLFAAWIVARHRKSLYRPLHLSLLGATGWQLGMVIHEHFPSEFFKYIALGTGLLIVLVFLARLLQGLRRPADTLLLKRRREAYRKEECPVCAFPHPGGAADGPAACPACGAPLFEPCPDCGATRPSLLPYCPACADRQPLRRYPVLE